MQCLLRANASAGLILGIDRIHAAVDSSFHRAVVLAAVCFLLSAYSTIGYGGDRSKVVSFDVVFKSTGEQPPKL